MCHSKEIEIGCKKRIYNLGGTDPPFRANLLFGYVQSGSERTSFSGSTVRVVVKELSPKMYSLFFSWTRSGPALSGWLLLFVYLFVC